MPSNPQVAHAVSPARSLEERSCPACASPSFSGPLSEENGYSLVRCNKCRMLYTRAVQTVEAKILHYDRLASERTDTTSTLSPAHYGLANQIKSVRLYDSVLKFVNRQFPRGNVNFIDVGCAGGLFLLAAQSMDGYHCGVEPRFTVRGISIDPRERNETERSVGCLVAFPDDAEAQWAGWADVITLMNVLEHVNNPFRLLGQLKRVLKPGGLLVVDVPNNTIASIRGTLFHWWPVLDLGEHINHFVPSTLDRLAIRAGFRPVKRLPGLLGGAESLGKSLSGRAFARWSIAGALMAMTGRKLQTFPHMTMAYRSD